MNLYNNFSTDIQCSKASCSEHWEFCKKSLGSVLSTRFPAVPMRQDIGMTAEALPHRRSPTTREGGAPPAALTGLEPTGLRPCHLMEIIFTFSYLLPNLFQFFFPSSVPVSSLYPLIMTVSTVCTASISRITLCNLSFRFHNPLWVQPYFTNKDKQQPSQGPTATGWQRCPWP